MSHDGNKKDFETKVQNAAAASAANENALTLTLLQDKIKKEEAAESGYNAYYARKKLEEAAALAAQNSALATPVYQAANEEAKKEEQKNSSQISAADLQYFQVLSRQIFDQAFGAPLPSLRPAPQRGRNNNTEATNNQATTVATGVQRAVPDAQAETTVVNNAPAEQPPVENAGSEAESVDSHEYKNNPRSFRPEFKSYNKQDEDEADIGLIKIQVNFHAWHRTHEILDQHRDKSTYIILNDRVNTYLRLLDNHAKLVFFANQRPDQADFIFFSYGLREFADDLNQAFCEANPNRLSNNSYALPAQHAKYRSLYEAEAQRVDVTYTSIGF